MQSMTHESKVTLVEQMTPEGETIFSPPIRYFGHQPHIRIDDQGEWAGCTCGWRSFRRSVDGMRSWWYHAFKERREQGA